MTTMTYLLYTSMGLSVGMVLGYVLARRHAARELARLWELVPEARLLRHAAEYAGLAAFRNLPEFGSPGEDSVALRNLAARIDVTNTLDRRALVMADRCLTCSYYSLPLPAENAGAWCYMFEEPPTCPCGDWKGKD